MNKRYKLIPDALQRLRTRLFHWCRMSHEWEFLRNIYGDEINMVGGARSVYGCHCGATKWCPGLHGDAYERTETRLRQTLSRMHQHRDEWRGYAYGYRTRPRDYLDSSDGIGTGEATLIERLEFDLSESQRREHELQRQLDSAHAELERIMRDSFDGNAR